MLWLSVVPGIPGTHFRVLEVSLLVLHALQESLIAVNAFPIRSGIRWMDDSTASGSLLRCLEYILSSEGMSQIPEFRESEAKGFGVLSCA